MLSYFTNNCQACQLIKIMLLYFYILEKEYVLF